MNCNSAASILYICHGGGPMPLLAGDEAHAQLRQQLRELAAALPKPEAIVVISAHWEENQPTITAAAKPDLIYDYSGFPEESYHIQYPAAGQPKLAQTIFSLLQQHDFNPLLDEQRGFDHGLFIPLKLMYPAADIPCLQLSLVNNLDAKTHIRMGEALSALKQENILILGSGFSFHNMQAFFNRTPEQVRQMNEAFENWLMETCGNESLSEKDRRQRLIAWEQAPHARYCHPREEHLLPLHVCYGLAGAASSKIIALDVLGVRASNYLWQF